MRKFLLFFLPVLFIASSCDPDTVADDDNPSVDFDRREMLAGWVDNVIVPGYADLEDRLADLVVATRSFSTEPSAERLGNLRMAYRTAYLEYQNMAPLLIGRAEELRLREQLNTYPTDAEQITTNLRDEAVNLALPSNADAQGFPALDYLLFGVDPVVYQAGEDANAYRNYLVVLVVRMAELTDAAAAEWTAEQREAFIANDGNSATASIDRTVNDYIFYYEKFLRAGKVGIPAGVFSDDPLPGRAEAPYSGLSPELFAASLAASRRFFLNHGLADYLDAMTAQRSGEPLSSAIRGQFDAARAAFEATTLPFDEQVRTDNIRMLELYNELQRNVILLKVDMLQALSINVDYVDADGD